MQPAAETERDRLRANIDAFARLFRMADRLRRANAAKWEVTPEEWRTAVQAALTAPVPHPADAAAIAEAIRAVRSAGGRLGNSGEARLGSAGVGRHPDSSRAGERFYEDLAAAEQRLTELRELDRA